MPSCTWPESVNESMNRMTRASGKLKGTLRACSLGETPLPTETHKSEAQVVYYSRLQWHDCSWMPSCWGPSFIIVNIHVHHIHGCCRPG